MSILGIALSFLLMLAFLFLSLPVATVLGLMGAAGAYLLVGTPALTSMGSVIWGVLNNNVLTAVPLFVLLGEILLRSGLARRMYEALALWMGKMPGGLLHTNIACCTLFAATSGSSLATAATIGTVALPAQQAQGYNIRQVLGSLAAGGTLGILIPPSLALLVYGALTNTSIGQLFIAGFIPGLLLALLFMVYIAIANWRLSDKQRIAASVPLAEKIHGLRFLLPPVVIFAVIIGSIYFGIATPTEAAAVGVIVSLVVAAVAGTLSFAVLIECFRNTARLTGMLMLIVVAAFILNLTLSFIGAPREITRWVTGLGLGVTELLLILVVLYLIMGAFFEVLSMQVATIPVIFPVMTALGVDPIWLGIFIVLMSEIAFITPPVGMNIYVVQGIRKDGGSVTDVMAGIVPYVLIMLAFTLLIIFVPEIVLWLPGRM